MKLTEAKDILNDIEFLEGDVDIFGVSINRQLMTVCYEDSEGRIKKHSAEYKNCDIH